MVKKRLLVDSKHTTSCQRRIDVLQTLKRLRVSTGTNGLIIEGIEEYHLYSEGTTVEGNKLDVYQINFSFCKLM